MFAYLRGIEANSSQIVTIAFKFHKHRVIKDFITDNVVTGASFDVDDNNYDDEEVEWRQNHHK